MTYSTLTVAELLEAVSSPTPAPGGGPVTALSAAMGVSLLLMVAGIPKTRHGMPDEVNALAATAGRLRPLRDELQSLADADSAAYGALLTAMRLPRGSEEERAAREQALQDALHHATDVPLHVMRACARALTEAPAVIAMGNANAEADAAIGTELLRAAARCAAMMVDVNLAGISDAAYRERAGRERQELESSML